MQSKMSSMSAGDALMYDVNNFDTASATIIPLKYKPPLHLLQLIKKNGGMSLNTNF